jgi:stage V sporulation protein B
MIFLGIGTSLILFVFAKPIVGILRWDMKSYYSLIGISLAPVVVSFITIFRGFFQGLQNMTPTAISQILEQVGRVVIGVGMAFLLLPRGIEYAAGGAALGAAGGGLFAAIYLFFKYKSVKKSMGIGKVRTNTDTLGLILKMSIPISVGATVGTIMSLIDSILVPQKLLEAGIGDKMATALYGQLTGKAAVLVNIPLTLSVAICTSLIPIIAETYILNRKIEMQSKINIALKLSAVIALPSAMGLFFLAEPIMKLIFFQKYEGVEILKYLSLSIPFVIATQTTTSILQATNHYIRPMINLLIGCLVKVVLTMFLVPIANINIYGAVIASITAYIVVAILNLTSLKKKTQVKVDFYQCLVRPAYSSVAMILSVILSYSFIVTKTESNSISCLLAIFVGIIIYILAILVFRVFEIEEIKSKLVRK